MKGILASVIGLILIAGCSMAPTPPDAGPDPAAPPPSPPPAVEPGGGPEPPPDARLHYEEALALIREQKWMAATQELRKAVDRDPQMAEAWNDLSYAALRQNLAIGDHAVPPDARLYSFQTAIEAAEQALQLRPGWAYAQYNLGLALLAQGQYSKAVEPLRRSGEQQPDRHEPLAALGLAYVGIGAMANAREVCRQARQVDPYSLTATECLELVGEAMKRLPDSEAAIGGRRYQPGNGFVGGDGEGQFYRVSPPYSCGYESPDGFRQSFIDCHGDPCRVGSIRFERLTPVFAVDNLIHDDLYPHPLNLWDGSLLGGALMPGKSRPQVEEQLGEGKPASPGERSYLYQDGRVRVRYSDRDTALTIDLFEGVETDRGVAVGDPEERVRFTYGKPETEAGDALTYRYTDQEKSYRLTFHIRESRVIRITLTDLTGN